MLRWLPSALYKKSTERQHFLQDILLFVFGAHLLFFLGMFGVSMFDSKQNHYSISMHQTGATYVLMPLQKKVDQPKQKARNGKAMSKKSQVVNYEDYLQRTNIKKRDSTKAIKRIQAVTVSKNKSSLKKVMKNDHATATLVEDRKSNVLQKNLLGSKKNKVKMVEVVTIKPVVQQQNKLLEELKPVVSAAQEVVDETIQAVSNVLDEPLDMSLDSQDTLEPFDVDNVVFVGYEQLDECVVGSKIQRSIQQSWTPPIGISEGTSCQMRVTISDQGLASTIKIEKSSGVFVYDTSARIALLQVEYPKEVWNKTITIVLGN